MAFAPVAAKAGQDRIPLTECYGIGKVLYDFKYLSEVEAYKGDAVVFVSRDALVKEAADFDSKRGGLLLSALKDSEFKGDCGSCVRVHVAAGDGPRHLIAIGTGVHNTFDPSLAGSTLAAALRDVHTLKSVALYIPEFYKDCPCAEAPRVFFRKLQGVLEALLVDLVPDYRFKGAGSKGLKASKLEKITIYSADCEGAKAAMKAAQQVASGVHLARELVNTPANVCTTVTLAQVARDVAEEGGLDCRILNIDEVEALGMGCFLAVAKGSIYPPQFIHLTYTPPSDRSGANMRRLALIGKGLCFDSGGYNIKKAETSIELMKFDMGGAAAVLGAAKAVGQIKPPNAQVHFIVAAAENMVSSKAYRPGDVLTAGNGITVEVGNTDAEGRLTLADALVYAEKLQVDAIVDVATLTGACIIALGESCSGLWSSDDKLAQAVLNCAEKAGEKMWRMPLFPRYKELLESKCADINNVGGKGRGGAITAAVFLKEFVGKTPWAHIDIAGPAWCYKTSMATGYGVRTLVELISNTSASCV